VQHLRQQLAAVNSALALAKLQLWRAQWRAAVQQVVRSQVQRGRGMMRRGEVVVVVVVRSEAA
jgi:hypothetical protein